jgi:H+-translocating NAD(P) transhydrogenase
MENEVNFLKPETTLVSFLYPGQNKALIDKLSQKKINAFGKKREKNFPQPFF